MPDAGPQLYLASGSPRRAELLRRFGLRFRVLAPEVDERPHPGETVEGRVARLARLKTEVAAERAGALPILAADTLVVLDGEAFGKPADRQMAGAMLRHLSGRTHQVLSAVCVRRAGRVREALSRSEVSFRPLAEPEIESYLASGEPAGKAGAYAVQGLAAAFVSRLAGSYSGVMGLPLFETAELLAASGVEILPAAVAGGCAGARDPGAW